MPCDVPWDSIIKLLESRILAGMTWGGFIVLALVGWRLCVVPTIRAMKGQP